MIFATKQVMKKIYIILITIVLIAATVYFHHRKENLENAEMESFAQIIADETDEDFETATLQIINEIKNDSLFNSWVKTELPSDDSLLSYFNEKYFNIDLYNLYNRTLVVCDSTTFIWYSEDLGIDCFTYFEITFLNAKTTKLNDNLYHVDDATSDIFYIAKINLNETETLYMEFYKDKFFNKFRIDADSDALTVFFGL